MLRIFRIIKEWLYEVKWAFQRAFRGWDDRALWDTGGWLARTLVPILEEVKKGVPESGISIRFFEGTASFDSGDGIYQKDREIAEEKYYFVLNEIISGLNTLERARDEWMKEGESPFEYKARLEKEIQEAKEKAAQIFKYYYDIGD